MNLECTAVILTICICVQFDEGAVVNEDDNFADFLDDFKADTQNRPVFTICIILCHKQYTNTLKLYYERVGRLPMGWRRHHAHFSI